MFIKASTYSELLALAPTMSVFVSVEGGFMAFKNEQERKNWKKSLA